MNHNSNKQSVVWKPCSWKEDVDTGIWCALQRTVTTHEKSEADGVVTWELGTYHGQSEVKDSIS